MELNLSPQLADTTIYEEESGGYYAWTGAKFPVLAEAEFGAGKLVLQPCGFALPHYADADKIGYVIQGTCTVGLVSPNNPQEKVLIINKGDAIPVTQGVISWWFNGGDSDTTIIFLGKSGKSYNPTGQFHYFFLTGALGFLGGFSTDFIGKIYNFNEADSIKLAKSQTNGLILKLGPEINMPSQSNCNKGEHVFSLNECNSIIVKNFPVLEKIGLSASLVRLGQDTHFEPSYSTDGSRIIYVVKGSGRVQIVGLNGTRVLDSSVHKDQLFVVPKYFVVALLTNEDGLELLSVTTSPRPVFGKLGGSTSTWLALSPPVLQASLNVSPEFVKCFKSKNQ
ncbi:hypothetical protein CDL12_21232 [Handroanthus impetiginosus]|uniref:Cupin type-1 domain-containing protein n=1 Tax=Handroanthus impetiginosus TaxID=429701 RepID=A0A2G9GLR4_9LAMI|nr:hypothetical protein CDL12_21232 [Handroanthus impetiginosus]